MGDLKMPDFIGVYDEALNPEVCQQVIDAFERSSKRREGITGQGKDVNKKQSEDIPLSLEPEWSNFIAFITQVTLRYLVDYMRDYSHLLTGAVCPAVQDASGKLVTVTAELIPELTDKAIANMIARLYYLGVINAQKYYKGHGGYHHYHSEIYPALGDRHHESLHRVLLFMYYLNEVAHGGETEFFYQKKFIQPKVGRLVIAPAGFTHTHKGHIPQSADKYILTSWVLFQPADYLYAANSMSR
jgi:hypothetical protein